MIYDVAIVGSGPSAAACHFSLMRSDRNISVCILEGEGKELNIAAVLRLNRVLILNCHLLLIWGMEGQVSYGTAS